MTPHVEILTNQVLMQGQSSINLPTRDKAIFSHIGQAHLPNGLILDKVLCVPHFKHSLLSVQKLVKDNNCQTKDNKIIPLTCLTAATENISSDLTPSVPDLQINTDVWHHRLGHAPIAKLRQIKEVKEQLNSQNKYVKTHFNKSIKYLRSDNALEFDAHRCQRFFANQEILHQTSCVKRPQQNARVEIKHRNRLEIARAIRFQSGLPLEFWGDCVLTAVHDYVTQNPTPHISNLADTSIAPTFHRFLSTLVKNHDPVHFKDVVKQPHWVKAMNDEITALESKKTWDITTLPAGKSAIGLAKMTTMRAILAVAAIQQWHAYQMDVTNAFLHGDLQETIYMKLPKGYTAAGSRIVCMSDPTKIPVPPFNLVCRLIKSLYGLKQSPRNWFHKISQSLLNLPFTQLRADYSLFVKQSEQSVLLIIIYVDDLLICGNDMSQITHFQSMLSQTFHMKNLGPVSYFLGIEINRSQDGFFLSQKKYTTDVLQEFGMVNVKLLQLPMDLHLKLTPEKGDLLPSPTTYQRLLRKLIYLTITRPDIVFTVQLLSQFMQAPTIVHMQAAKRLLRYLARTSSQGLLLASTSAAQLTAVSPKVS
ncbi:hypothetical protein AgCh_025812 [Apium graveolens]